MQSPRPVLAVTGLKAEARIAAGAGVTTVVGGGDPARLALLLQGTLSKGASAVISFGIAGGLRPGLRPGTMIIGRSVDDGQRRAEADAAWCARLAAALPEAIAADIAGVDRPAKGVAQKGALHAATGAAAVDMESHIAARLATLHGVPFAALRIIADPWDRTLPGAALVGMRPDGSADVGAVLRALGRRPADLAALIRTAFDARAALQALRHSRQRLSPRLGFDGSADQVSRPGRPRGGDAGVDSRPVGSGSAEVRATEPEKSVNPDTKTCGVATRG